MKEKILFVTKGGDNFEEGFAYAVDLAKTMKAGIIVLMVLERQISGIFEDLMAAAAYAEAGDEKTAEQILLEKDRELQEAADRRFLHLSVPDDHVRHYLGLEIRKGDVSAAVKSFLKSRADIDMVLLSPCLAENRRVFDVRRFVKNITKPVVTISRSAGAEA